MQAISAIVAHRTDDNSKLPALLPVAEQQTTKEADKGPKRLKLRLQNAPQARTAQDAEAHAGASVEDKEEWEDIASVRFCTTKCLKAATLAVCCSLPLLAMHAT